MDENDILQVAINNITQENVNSTTMDENGFIQVQISSTTQENLNSTTMDEKGILQVAINYIKHDGKLSEFLPTMIWNNSWWLPNNLTWDDIQPTKDFKYPEFSHTFTYPFMLSVFFIAVKYKIIYPIILGPMAYSLGIWCKKHPPSPNAVLEDVFKKFNTNPDSTVIKSCVIKLGWPERQIEGWLRQRKSIETFTKYDNFLLCGYECLSHSFFTIFGFFVMFNKPYLWDISLCWSNYPHHAIDSGVWWYYMLIAGWYWAQLMIHMFLPSRKDKPLVIIHHFCTIFLLTFSWICNFVRIGTLVILVHEVADIFLMTGKMCAYSKKSYLTNILFALFAISWTITRTGLYPFWIMHSVFTDAAYLFTMPSASMFESFLVIILLLNIFWTCLIFMSAFSKLLGQGSGKDKKLK